jgi:hypothetical protein
MRIGEQVGMGLELGMRSRLDPTRRAAEELARAATPRIPGVGIWRNPDLPVASGDIFPSTGRAGGQNPEVTALRNEIRALREQVKKNDDNENRRHEEKIEVFRNVPKDFDGRMDYRLKNNKETRQNTRRGQTSELERHLFGGR